MSRSELYHAHNKIARKMGFPEIEWRKASRTSMVASLLSHSKIIQAVSNVDFSNLEKFDKKVEKLNNDLSDFSKEYVAMKKRELELDSLSKIKPDEKTKIAHNIRYLDKLEEQKKEESAKWNIPLDIPHSQFTRRVKEAERNTPSQLYTLRVPIKSRSPTGKITIINNTPHIRYSGQL